MCRPVIGNPRSKKTKRADRPSGSRRCPPSAPPFYRRQAVGPDFSRGYWGLYFHLTPEAPSPQGAHGVYVGGREQLADRHLWREDSATGHRSQANLPVDLHRGRRRKGDPRSGFPFSSWDLSGHQTTTTTYRPKHRIDNYRLSIHGHDTSHLHDSRKLSLRTPVAGVSGHHEANYSWTHSQHC